MECNTAQTLLAYRRPGGPSELAPDDTLALDRHLATCPACASIVNAAARFDTAMATAMRAVTVPTGLKNRMLTAALAKQGAAWRHTIARSTAAASAACVVLGLTGGVYWLTRPHFPTEAVADKVAQELENPEPVVRSWLTDQGLPPTLPLNFDYRNYGGHGKTQIDGVDVPVVNFQLTTDIPGNLKRKDMARVLIVRSTRFDLDKVRDTQNSFVNVQVIRDEKHGLAYVIFYTTETPKPFLKKVIQDQI